jgi:hypothetical protein
VGELSKLARAEGPPNAGNASARLLVEELRKRGVTINPGK